MPPPPIAALVCGYANVGALLGAVNSTAAVYGGMVASCVCWRSFYGRDSSVQTLPFDAVFVWH